MVLCGLRVLSHNIPSKGCLEPPTFPISPPGGCGRGTKHGCAGRCCSASAPLPAPCEAFLVMSRGCISPWRTVQEKRECQAVQQCRDWGGKGWQDPHMGTVASARSIAVPKGQVTQLCVRITACGKGCSNVPVDGQVLSPGALGWSPGGMSLLCLATWCLVCCLSAPTKS